MKYIIGNLKDSLNDKNVQKYVDIISKNKYEGLIICPSYEYLKYFDNMKNIGNQDYYEDRNEKYVIIGHYDRRDTIQEIKEKIKKATEKNITIILCIGNKKLYDIEDIKNQLDKYLDKICIKDIIIAYEPISMIGNNKEIDIEKLNECITYIKKYFNNKVKVIYGGNVNEKNISNILEICDGILAGRLSFDPQKFTYIIDKYIKKV